MQLLAILSVFIFSTESDVRAMYIKALDNSSIADKLVSTCEPKKKIPFYRAYYACGLGFQAKHSWNPATKLSKAKDAATELNTAVSLASNDFEVRFLRFSYEAKVPAIVGITKHTSDDKKWLLSHLNRSHPMWSTMKKFLKNCELLTQKEKDSL